MGKIEGKKLAIVVSLCRPLFAISCRSKLRARRRAYQRSVPCTRNFMLSERLRCTYIGVHKRVLFCDTMCGIASYGTSWLYVVQVGYISTCNMYTPESRKAASSWCQFRVTYRLGRFHQIRILAVWPGWHAMRYVKKCS